MLAVLLIEMTWFKEDRTPNGASIRKKYDKPVRIEDGINLIGNGIFYKKCCYFQHGDCVLSEDDVSCRPDKELYETNSGKAFTGAQERELRRAGQRGQRVRQDKGSFYSLEKIDVPCVTISEEADKCYRIRWYDDGRGRPRRRGGNEDLYKKGAKLAGQPNTLNETAFILEEEKVGLLRYNYRYTSYDGQWYKYYCVYAVNAKVLTQDIFIRDYDYEYLQMADLF